MVRALPITAFVVALSLWIQIPALAEDPPVDATTNADLDARIKELEGKLQTCETQLAKSGTMEIEARDALQVIRQLVSESKFDEARVKMTEFKAKYNKTRYVTSAANIDMELQVLGKDAPKEWGIQKWFQGEKDVDLSSKKTTLLVFWESWCGYCQKELPNLQKVWDANKDKGFQMVALTRITKSATEDSVTKFITEKQLTYPVAKIDGAVSGFFNVSGIPAAAVLKGGKVVWRGNPVALSEEMIQRWL